MQPNKKPYEGFNEFESDSAYLNMSEQLSEQEIIRKLQDDIDARTRKISGVSTQNTPPKLKPTTKEKPSGFQYIADDDEPVRTQVFKVKNLVDPN